MKNRRLLVRLFCILLACAFLPVSSFAESVPEEIIEIAEVTAKPEVTEEPEITVTPEVTVESEITATPEVTEEPEITAKPEVTEEPEITVTPEVTVELEITATPEATEEPEITAMPEVTVEPEITVTPEVTVEPEITATPEAIAAAAETMMPELPEPPLMSDAAAGVIESADAVGAETAYLPGSGSGSFCLAAYTGESLLIAPMIVNYTVSDTLISALEKLNGHTIVDLESGEISRIDGVDGNFSRYDEDGGYDLTQYASDVEVLVFTDGAMPSEGVFELIRVMAEYSDSADAKNNEAAVGIYQQIVNSFTTLSEADAAAWAEKLAAAMSGGEMPSGDPNAPAQTDGIYLIGTGGEMKWFADHTRTDPSADAKLTGDISLSGIEWTPIGSPGAPYTGSFDGCGYKISNLSISVVGDYQALFGYAGSGAEIKNLTVSGTVDAGGSYTAGIIAYCEADVSNLHNYCKVTSSGQYIGGVVGALGSKQVNMTACTNSGSIYASNASGAAYVGGVLGGNSGNLTDCSNSGAVTGYAYVGGIAGQATNLSGCTNTGDIQCVREYVGGIAGKAAKAENCENKGAVTASGVYIEVRARYEADYIGGIGGYVSSAKNCVNRGRILSRESTRTHFTSAAGVAGKASSVSDCENHGTVSVSGSYIAGIVGGNGGGSVLRCANFADILNATSGGEQTGGIASAGNIEQCYNTGKVTGYDFVGGISGGTTNTTLKYCYNLGAVSGNNYVGGITGNCLSVVYCYNAADVKAAASVSGLIAGDYSSEKECFYLNEYTLYSKAGAGLDYAGLRLSMLNVPHFNLNPDVSYHNGYPWLDFENAAVSVAADSVSLKPGDKQEYFAISGSEAAGLPGSVRVQAGGIEFICSVEWQAPSGYDNNTAGRYTFTPSPSLPNGCIIGDTTQLECVTVVICAEEELPLVTAVALEEGAPTEYSTPYGKNPEGLPEYVLATVDGNVQLMAVEWDEPADIDLTDTETQLIYTMRFCEAVRIDAGAVLPTVSVRVKPMMLISGMRFTETISAESREFELRYNGAEIVDGVQTFRYTLDIFDSTEAVYICAQPEEVYADSLYMEYTYNMLNSGGYENTDELTAGKITGLSGFAATNRKFTAENTMVLHAQAETDAGFVAQDYVITTSVHPTLGAAAVMMGNTAAYMTPVFDSDWLDYRVQIISGTETVEFRLNTTVGADKLGGIEVLINDAPASAGEDGAYAAVISVTGDETPVSVKLRAKDSGIETAYLFSLVRLQETMLSVSCAPEDAKVKITNRQTGSVFADANGRYSLIRSFEYEYTVSAYGYVTQTGAFTADGTEMTLDIRLEPAEKNENINEDMEAVWEGFRGDETNNAVSGSSTPVSASDAVLYWANQAGIDYGSDAVSSPILAGGYLICTAKQNIFKIDTITGEIVQVGDMIKKSSFNITPPTYAKGMIFVALADGIVQAFNADTLESLWVYTDPLGGQPNSPLTYRNGYVYTGFWNGEADDGNWVCLSATDEDPTRGTEAKEAAWTYTQKGGFYWAGACVQDNFMIVGTDDGATGYISATSNLLSLDPDTGRLIDCLTGLEADIRCTVCYDSVTDRYYFTSKGGYFYSVAVTEDGYFRRDSLKKLDLRDGKEIEGMSTSTPVVYNGRAYVGVSGVAQFKPYSGHGIAVIDLAAWEIAYMCPTRGYPQTSGLLTNAYENTGLVYIYFFDNMTPGSLRVIRDCPGQTSLLSIYDGSPIQEAEILFTPRGAQRQYALCSPIVDEYGTFYFKNDSGHMMALGSRVVSLEVTQQPDKVLYEAGESFDPAGMKVVQHLANGCVRDVTQSVSWSAAPLTEQDTDITIYFDYVRYNDDFEVIDRPQTAVNLTVLSTADMAAVRAVVDGINALGAVTIDSRDDIKALRAAYDALPLAQKELVTNYELLTRAEEACLLLERAEMLAAERVVRLIDAIGDVTLDSADTIRSAFELYNSLSEFGRAFVTNYDTLVGKQSEYNELVKASDAEAYALMNDIAGIGEVTVESGSLLYSLRDRYENLPESSRQLVTNISSLEAAEALYAELIEKNDAMARQVIDMIEAIGSVTLDKESVILRARDAYDALDENVKAEITNYDKLLAAEAALEQLKQQLGGLSEVTAQLDEIAAQIYAAAADDTQVTAENAPVIAPLIYQISQLINAQTPEDQALLSSYSRMTDGYRIAISTMVHSDAATGVVVEGLEWYQQLKIETLTSDSDADYSRFKSLISPQRVIKLYRATIVDMVHGQQDINHASLELKWTIPVPKYNESSYSAIGVVHVGDAAAAQYLESSYANHNRSLKFATRGDGLIGVGGTKAQMNAAGSVTGSGSVLGGVTGSGSVLDGQEQSGKTDYREFSYGGMYGGGKLTSYSETQKTVFARYGNVFEDGAWYYRDIVIIPAMLAKLTDAQVNLYRDMSIAVENGTNRFFGYTVTPEEFEQVYEAYRMSNPLSALVEMTFVAEAGMVEADYVLSEDAHFEAVADWRARVEEIINYCLIQGDTEVTAARIYQYLAQTLVMASEEWSPAEDDDMLAFWPGPYYALMNGRVSENDAAKIYAYMLMQVGLESMYAQEAEAPAEDIIIEETASQGTAEHEITEEIPHIWNVLWQGWLYTHADLEMDIRREAEPEFEPDTLGHFGMNDEKRAESVNDEYGYELIMPESMQIAEDERQDFSVPECMAALSGYVAAEPEAAEESAGEVEE